jgi:polyhydroxyalkanoate synthesis regulator phasin
MPETATSLLPADQTEHLMERWEEIQTSFVDEPQTSVEEADALVSDLMQRLMKSFSSERQRLESQWAKGDDVSTEDLRLALTRYRSFFERLLSA